MNPAELFSRESNPLRLAPDEVLFQAGERGDSMYVVLEGALEILVDNRVVGRSTRGDIIGETALIDEQWHDRRTRGFDACKGGRGSLSTAHSTEPLLCNARDESAGGSRPSRGSRASDQLSSADWALGAAIPNATICSAPVVAQMLEKIPIKGSGLNPSHFCK